MSEQTYWVEVHPQTLTGRALDWAVAKCKGLNPNTDPAEREQYVGYSGFAEANGFGHSIKHYSIDWGQLGPIVVEMVERYRMTVGAPYRGPGAMATVSGNLKVWRGDTVAEAVLRCYVETTYGDRIIVPRCLVKVPS